MAGLMHNRDFYDRLTRRQARNRERLVAIHEASHALVAILLGGTTGTVTIVPADDGSDGKCSIDLPETTNLLARLTLTEAGPVGEAVLNAPGNWQVGPPLPRFGTPATSDDERAAERSMRIAPPQWRGDVDVSDADRVRAYAMLLAGKLIHDHRAVALALVDLLILRRTIDAAEARLIVFSRPVFVPAILRMPGGPEANRQAREESDRVCSRIRRDARRRMAIGRNVGDDEQVDRPTTR